jgi:Tol biopolymer transport system component
MLAATLVLSVAPAGADGGEIAYITNDERSIHLVQADGSGDRQLAATPQGATDLAWSPDGKTLAYGLGSMIYGYQGPQKIVVYDISSGRSTQFEGGIGDIAFFPDGKHLVVQSGTVSHLCGGGLYILDLTTGATTPINLEVACVGGVQVTSDGSAVVFTGQLGAQFDPNPRSGTEEFNLATGETTMLTASDQNADGIFSGASLSPDNQTLATVTTTGRGDASTAELALLDRDGSNPRTVWRSSQGFVGGGGVSFSPDGTRVLLYLGVVNAANATQGPNSTIWLVGLDGSNPHQVATGFEATWRPVPGVAGAAPAPPSVPTTAGPPADAPPSPAPDAPGSAGPADASTAPTNLTDDVRADVLAAVDRANAAWAAASQTLDPSGLSAAVGGQELADDLAELDTLRQQGHTRTNINTQFSVADVTLDAPGHAVVHTHETWYAEIHDAASGRLLQRTPASAYAETYSAEYVDGAWLITRIDL